MNEHAQQWLEALRSGDYEQTYEMFSSQGQFCAIGVACDLISPSEPVTSELIDHVTTDYLHLTHEGVDKIVSMNDDQEMTFSQIADQIESSPSTYFETS